MSRAEPAPVGAGPVIGVLVVPALLVLAGVSFYGDVIAWYLGLGTLIGVFLAIFFGPLGYVASLLAYLPMILTWYAYALGAAVLVGNFGGARLLRLATSVILGGLGLVVLVGPMIGFQLIEPMELGGYFNFGWVDAVHLVCMSLVLWWANSIVSRTRISPIPVIAPVRSPARAAPAAAILACDFCHAPLMLLDGACATCGASVAGGAG